MNYYEVDPATNSFHGREPLTYSFPDELQVGQVVEIKLRSNPCLGLVINKTKKPDFKVVELESILKGCVASATHLSLLLWMLKFYPSTIGVTAQLFVPSFLKKFVFKEFNKDSGKLNIRAAALPKLTDEQSKAYKAVRKNSKAGQKSSILHGITGSGKTRLYMELARDCLENNKSVLILTPEISLTTPLSTKFKEVFGNIVQINHSSMTPKQRLELFTDLVSSNKPRIIIGPRSSLFLPLNNIGLIVVDEFHESAYKQESQPFYHANRVASMLAKLSDAEIIFGSATPPLSDYYLAEQKGAPVIEMQHSAITSKKPKGNVLIINLLDSDEKTGHSLLSKTLLSEITKTLNNKEQAMLFINKRGSARSIACQNCGHKELCENCDLPMVYHSDQHLIRCHTCGSSRRPPVKCPDCGSVDIYFSSPGTKAIADSLSKIFPQAKIGRFDKDNKKSERLENNYDETVKDIDIIVGTQIIAKGHDLPRLSLVAMLQADSGLDFPDYSSSERNYQLIKQLSGRVNRGHRDGIFLIQTFNSKNNFIKKLSRSDWNEFYKQEMKQRQKHHFPPFYSSLKVESARKTKTSAINSLDNLLTKLEVDLKNIEILGPSPSFVEKKSSKWHWQIILISRQRPLLVEIARKIPSTFTVNIDPNNFL